MSCSLRGVECEGYVLRWVDAAARGTLTGQTYAALDHETDMHLALELRTPSKAKTTKPDGVENSPYPNHQAKVASKAEPPEIHEHVTESECSSVLDTKSRAISILRQQSWSILMVVGTASDDLGGLVKYCTKTPRRSVIGRY
jgi:hypothetical protein